MLRTPLWSLLNSAYGRNRFTFVRAVGSSFSAIVVAYSPDEVYEAMKTTPNPGGEMSTTDTLDGRDSALIAALLPTVRRLNAHYLRLRIRGFDQAPKGPVLYVGNHNGGIAGPDLCATLGSLWDAHGAESPLFMLAHDFAMVQVPPFGRVIRRFGAVRATPDNALAGLASGAQVLVYPGGDLDAYRHARRRDEVVLGPRTGFVRVAQAAGVPIVPIVAHGAHRSAYILTEGESIARWLRMEEWARLKRFPIALALPWGLAVGPWLPYFPLPLQVQLHMLPPVPAPPGEAPEVIRDRVQAVMQAALHDMARDARRVGGAAP